jgi:hypothetical protein
MMVLAKSQTEDRHADEVADSVDRNRFGQDQLSPRRPGRELTTVAIIKDRHVRIIIMRPETILH